MGSLIIMPSSGTKVISHPFAQIFWWLLNIAIGLLSQCELIKLILNRFIETLTDAIGLRWYSLSLGIINRVNGQGNHVGQRAHNTLRRDLSVCVI